ncbi:MAG: glucose-6-phosphate dehydrogenase [Thermoleophilia bacterium]
MIRRMIVLGAGGDLAARLLLPALAGLLARKRLPADLEVVCVDRAPLDDATFRAHVRTAVGVCGDAEARASADALAAACAYHQGDAGDPEALRAALGDDGEPVVLYLALPPVVFAPAITAAAEVGLPEGSRMVVEKPFGTGLESARELNALLRTALPEAAIHRMDHFLGKQTVQNILGLRFANRVVEPILNREHVERVDVIWDETLALEGRAGYYDRAGALRDMIQNHLLQIMTLLAMEPPPTLHERDLRDRKVDLLRSVRTPDRAALATESVRARYTSGDAVEGPVPDYAAEEGVDPAHGTETFAALTLWVDSWRWSGVPFTLRSGKALGVLRQQAEVHFRPVPHLAFGQDQHPQANVLTFGLAPDRLTLSVNVNGEGEPFTLEQALLEADFPDQDISAYGRVILDILDGDATLSIRGDEAEEAWRIIEPVLDAWGAGVPGLTEYPAGSEGPPVPVPPPGR